jgi:geranylgeranyl pyrophosphate synthase
MVLEASGLGSASGDDVLAAMRAVELLHVATLLHDDVIDGGRIRRGEPSVSYRYGAFAAQCSGGWMLGAAAQLASGLGQAAIELFAEAVGETCVGQILEMQQLWDRRRSQADYERTVMGKTGSLFGLSAQLGGLIAGIEAAQLGALGRFGRCFGMAFQFADDLLDLLADPAETGKEHGIDVRHGVYTLPVLYALESDPELLGPAAPDMEEIDLEDVVERVLRTDAVARVISRCEAHLSVAVAVAQDLEAPGLLKFVDEFHQSMAVLA